MGYKFRLQGCNNSEGYSHRWETLDNWQSLTDYIDNFNFSSDLCSN
jgi:hypothetical protein